MLTQRSSLTPGSIRNSSTRTPPIARPSHKALLPITKPKKECRASSSGSSDMNKNQPQPQSPASSTSNSADSGSQPTNQTEPQPQKKPFMQRVKEFFSGSKEERDKLAALGMGAFASYGFISNLNYGTALGISWIGFVKATGTSPLWPGQWKPFLAFYAGMWAVQNFVRPLRFALAVALAPTFDKVITWISARTRLSKPLAFGVMLFCLAIVTTSTLFSALYFCGGLPPAPQAV